MSYTSSSDSFLIDLPPSLSKDQIQLLPLANSIGEGDLLTAPKIATAYKIPASTGANVKVGIISLGGGFSQTDLDMSMADLGLTAPTITFVGVDGAVNDYTGDPSYDGENTLDLICVAGMVPNANIILYKGLSESISFYTNPTLAAIVNRTNSFANVIQRAVDDDCDIISISWGTSEKAVSGNTTYYCGDWLAGPLANAAANGITVFVAAGDYGSQAINSEDPEFQVVSADYPSVNANVIAVGGTYLTLNVDNTRNTETVYNNSESLIGFGGGGGVSSMISRPSWQANLNYKTYPANTTSTLSNRGIPDISAAMNAYGAWLDNNLYGFSGTSASAPIMAGMLARFISISGNRPSIGEVNSTFYNNTGSFLDITTGNNASLLPDGYASSTGWDAVTGLGPQSNAIQTYQTLYPNLEGVKVKTSSGWQTVQNITIKTSANTWTTVHKVWNKTANGWIQSY